MKKLILFIVLCFTQINFSQELLMETDDVLSPDVIEPKFKNGGVKEFYAYINNEFDFKKVTKNGKMITTFLIDENGEIKNIRIIQMVDVASATEIIRVLKLAPKWTPAMRAGKPFTVKVSIPLEFVSLNQEIQNKEIEKSINVKNEEPINPSDPQNSLNIEVAPEFNGGTRAFYKFIGKNFRVPDVSGLNGKVIIAFVVDKDGTLTDLRVLKDMGYGTGAEAIRVLKLTSGKWTPGLHKGVPVRCSYTLPITINTP
jgi:hypothetical protein